MELVLMALPHQSHYTYRSFVHSSVRNQKDKEDSRYLKGEYIIVTAIDNVGKGFEQGRLNADW
jgi:hypothetical protein